MCCCYVNGSWPYLTKKRREQLLWPAGDLSRVCSQQILGLAAETTLTLMTYGHSGPWKVKWADGAANQKKTKQKNKRKWMDVNTTSVFIRLVALAAVAGSLFTMLISCFDDPLTHVAACRAWNATQMSHAHLKLHSSTHTFLWSTDCVSVPLAVACVCSTVINDLSSI